jgi:hypothetical protein
MMPCSSITIIASGIVSRIERKCLSRVLTGVLKAFLTVDADHDTVEPRSAAIGTIDDGAERTHPVTFIRLVQPVLNVEIAPGIDRLLHGLCRAIAILRVQQGKEKFEVDSRIGRGAEELSGGAGPVQLPG